MRRKPSKSDDPKLDSDAPPLELPGALGRALTLAAPRGEFGNIALSPDGRRIAVAVSTDQLTAVVRIYSLADGSWSLLPGTGTSKIAPIAWDPTGEKLAVGTHGGEVAVWCVPAVDSKRKKGLKPRSRSKSLWRHDMSGYTHSFGPGDELQLKSLPAQPRGKRSVDSNAGRRRQIYALAWSPDGERLAVAGGGPKLLIVEGDTGRVLAARRGSSKGIPTVIWPRPGTVITGSFDHSIGIWNATDSSSFELDERLRGHRGFVNAVAILPDGQRLLSAGEDNTIRQWDLTAMRQIGIVEGFPESVRALSMHPSGQWFAVKGAGGLAWLIHAESLQRLAKFETHSFADPIYGISASSEKSLIAFRGPSNTRISVLTVKEDQLLDARASASTRYANAKVVLVGDTGVGKTGLALRLRGKRWRQTDSTHGRKVHLLESFNDTSDPNGPIRRDVLLWDLAGQSDYRLTHQLHLDMATVALVLFDARDPKRPLEAPEYWSHALSLARVQDPIVKVLVAAREDRTGVGLPERVLDEFCERHGFIRWFRTSARKALGVPELREFALEHIDWGKLPIITSTGWLEAVRALVERSRRNKRGGQIQTVSVLFKAFNKNRTKQCPFHEFVGCLERLDGADVVRLLVFERAGAPVQGGTLVLLEPEFVDAYASAIVNAAKNDPGGIGSLPEIEVLAGQFVMDEDERLSDKGEQKELLRYVVGFLLDHELALRDEERPGDAKAKGLNYLVFPSLYTADMPFPDKLKHAIWWRFTGPVRNFFTVLLARLARHRDFSQPEYWRDAARFSHRGGGKVVAVLSEKGTGTAELALGFEKGIGEPVQEALSFFVDGMFEDERFRSKYTKWRTQRCVKCDYQLDHEASLSRQLRGENDVICASCGTHQPFWHISDRQTQEGSIELARLKADASVGTQRDVAATVIAGLEAENRYDVLISYSRADAEEVIKLAETLKELGIRPWLDVWEIIPGQRWQPQLQAALKRIRRALVCIGPKGNGPWQDLEMDVLLKNAVKREDRIIPVLLPGAPKKPKIDVFWEQLQSVDLRTWKEDNSMLNTLVGAIFGEAPGRMRGISVDAPWIAKHREAMTPTKKRLESEKVTLTLHADFGPESRESLEAVRAQIAARLNIPSDMVRVQKVRKGSVKITFEFANADDAARLVQQVQAGNENILTFFERWSAHREEFMAENAGIHFHGSAEVHGPVAIGKHVTQAVAFTKSDAQTALQQLHAFVEAHVIDKSELAEARKLVGGADAELDEDVPDRSKVAKRTCGVVEVLAKVGHGSKWFNDVVKCGTTIANFCGSHGGLLLQTISAIVGNR